MSRKTPELFEEFDALPEDPKWAPSAESSTPDDSFDSGQLDDEETTRAAADLLALPDAEDNFLIPR